MNKRKLTTKEKALLIVLVVLMVAVVGVGAFLIINNVNQANEQAKNPTSLTATGDTSLLVATTAEQIDNQPEVTKKSTKKKSSSAKSSNKNSSSKVSKSSTTSKNSSEKSESSNTNSSSIDDNLSSKTSSGSISVVQPTTNSSHKSKDICTINGTKCYVGDTITVRLNLTTPKILENFQGYTEYDTSFLQNKTATVNVNSSIINCKDGTIYYNGSDISTGYDFTSAGTLYTATFKVLKSGTTKLTNTMEVLTDMKDVAVSPSDCKIKIKVFD